MRSSKLLCVLMLATGVVACSRGTPPAAPVAKSTPPPAPVAAAKPTNAGDVRKAELMRAIFAERYNATKGTAVALIPVDGEETPHIMSPVDTTDLPDGRTILIVNGSPSDEQGEGMAGHASPGMLNVYVLRRDGGRWAVTERRENVDLLGSSGNIGVVQWITLGPGKPGFIVSHGGIWQGYWINNAAIYSLDDGLHSMGTFAEGSGNDGACMPEVPECWNVDGDIRVATEPQPSGYQDIVVDFTDKRYTVKDGAKGDFVEQLKSQTKQTARYHFDGKEYVLVSGTNPVPGI